MLKTFALLGALILLSCTFLVSSSSSSKVYEEQQVTFHKVSNGVGCGFHANRISYQLKQESLKWRSNKGILRPRRLTKKSYPHYPMPKETVREMVFSSWRAFGASKYKANKNTRKNLKQIYLESSFIPYIKQGYIGDVNDNNPAGGLFQFIPETYRAWKFGDYGDRFNPLANILAAVNAQVNSGMKKVLNGKSGWGPGYLPNPCR